MALESSVLQQKSLWNIKNDQNQSNQIKNILRFKDVYIFINEKNCRWKIVIYRPITF